jgi:hypothetical protein
LSVCGNLLIVGIFEIGSILPIIVAFYFCIYVHGLILLVEVYTTHDTIIFVINFINSKCAPCHVVMGLFEVINMVGIVMAIEVKYLSNHVTNCWTNKLRM